MIPNKKTDEYTRYCITPEGKEYLRKMLEDKSAEDENDNEFELNMDEEIDFEHLKIFDINDDDFEPDEEDIIEADMIENELLNDEFFRLNEKPNDDDYDLWKETSS
ncbi:MAG: hypothetical protein JST55_14665 [Bacteroidetes bacterium]|nr:hypothetical protein [Bacteroidota bacterium]